MYSKFGVVTPNLLRMDLVGVRRWTHLYGGEEELSWGKL